MIDSIVSYLKFGNRFCSIEHTLKNGNEFFIGTVLKKSNKKIDIEDSYEEDSLELLINKLPKKQHIFLVVNDGNVLTKKIESNQIDNLKLVNSAFPNINIEDFYYEVLHQGNIHFISICRKKLIEGLIKQYSQFGLSVLDISLGNLAVSGILNYINSDEVFTSNSRLSSKDGNLALIEQKTNLENKQYNINGLKSNSNQLLTLSGALNSALQNHSINSNFESQKQLLTADYNNKRFFDLFKNFSLLFIFGLLLVNFLFFNHYFNKVNSLQEVSQINQSKKNTFLSLNKQVSKTEKMVEDILKSNSSKSSFYFNDIIQSIPNSILLSELNFQPLTKRVKADQDILVNSNTIIVSGKSNDSELYSNWITELESKSWIKQINLIDYKDTSKTVSDFSFKIKMNDE